MEGSWKGELVSPHVVVLKITVTQCTTRFCRGFICLLFWESQSVDSYLFYFSLINKAFLTVISSACRCCWSPSSNSAFGISLPIAFCGSCCIRDKLGKDPAQGAIVLLSDAKELKLSLYLLQLFLQCYRKRLATTHTKL